MYGSSEAGKMALRRNYQGQTMYPVCLWATNYKRLEKMREKTIEKFYEGRKELGDIKRINEAINILSKNVHEGIVYATEEDAETIKKFILKGEKNV